jgi:hypothetical protein
MRKGYLKLAYQHRKKYPLGVIRTIFLDNYEPYKKHNIVRPVEEENVLKMLACRTPLLGKHIYECDHCGHIEEHPHSCKSRLCSVCGYIATENWIRSRFNFLLNCHYHHVVVTIPAYYRWIIKQDRTVTLNLFIHCAAETLMEWSTARGYEVALICFFHAFNRYGKFHPHFHILTTAGGITEDMRWYRTAENIPGNVLMPIFRAKFTSGIKELFRQGIVTTKAPLSRVFYQISHQADEHWQFFTDRITRESSHTMEYCARYCKKMVMSESRIIDYDKKSKDVTFWDSKFEKVLVYDVEIFMKCILQAVPDKYFHLVRFYGFYSNRSKKKYAVATKEWQSLAVHREKLSWALRQTLRNYNDPKYPDGKPKNPLVCPKCKTPLKLKKIIYPEPKYRRTLENIKIVLGLAVEQKLVLNTS